MTEESGQIMTEESEPIMTESKEETLSFDGFGFCDEIMQGIKEAGFTEPTPIQIKAIPPLMEGKDVIGQALTGTGKTAAFGLPLMNKMVGLKGLRLLVLVPTRELAAQVSAELFRLGHFAGIHTAAFTGGQSYSRQEKLLAMGIDALVATPGRLIDLIESGHFKDVHPEYIVVDEADEMLDMGFLDDVKRIFEAFNNEHQTMLFSATMPRPVVELAEKILKAPVNITTSVAESTNNDIEQFFFVIQDSERIDAIVRLIDAQDIGKAMIFCRTKEETDALNILLGGRGYNVNCLHGDMEQAQRSRVMAAFRRGEIDILVATDVAARGLDVDDVTHVFNFHLPFDSTGYVHRIGRTGRAGKAGTAITLVTPREMRQLEAIKRTVGAQIENRLIPTRTEVTSLRLKKIFHDLNDYPLDMDILHQVQTLSVNQDLVVLLAKLIGHSLSGGADQGPEHIGFEGQKLDRILSNKPLRERDRQGERKVRRDRDDERHSRKRRQREEHLPTPPEERSIYEQPEATPQQEALSAQQPDIPAPLSMVPPAEEKRSLRDRFMNDDAFFGAPDEDVSDEHPLPPQKHADKEHGKHERPRKREERFPFDKKSRKRDDKFSFDRKPRRRDDEFSFDRKPRRHDDEFSFDRKPRRHDDDFSFDRKPRRHDDEFSFDRKPRRHDDEFSFDRKPRRHDDEFSFDRKSRKHNDDFSFDRKPRKRDDDFSFDRKPRKHERDDLSFDSTPRKLSGFGDRGFTGNLRTDLGKPGKPRRKDGFGHPTKRH